MKQYNRNSKLFVLLFLIVVLIRQEIEAAECESTPPTLNVGFKEKRLNSPGYPGHYSNNMDCMWVFEAAQDIPAEFGIQVAAIEIELDPDNDATTVGQCDNDYLEIFEGKPLNLGQSLGIWCGQDIQVLTSANRTLTLKFHSNNHLTGKGFIVEYALVKLASTKCRTGNITTVYVGKAPLYVDFMVDSNEARCTWQIEATDNNGITDNDSKLVVEALSIPRVPCDEGAFVLFDGPNSSNPDILHWCNGGESFSTGFLLSSYATLLFTIRAIKLFQSDNILLKLYTMSNKYPQVCSDHVMPEVQANKNPIYFHLPIADTNGEPCPMNVSHGIENNFLRIDVLSIDGSVPTCDSDVLTVNRAPGDAGNLEKSCYRRKYPIYLLKEARAIISSTRRLLLKAVSVDPACSGVRMNKSAFTSLILEDTIPQGFMHSPPTHNCISKYLITARDTNLGVVLSLEWTLPHNHGESPKNSDTCQGDFVNVYDGNNESLGSLMFSTCHKTNYQHLFIERKILSKSSSMLIVFNTDDVADANTVHVTYFAVPKNTVCSELTNITVNKTVQELTSPNYPDFYHLDYDCKYNLTANNPKDEIVFEAVDTAFSHGCDNVVHIYNGNTGRIFTNYFGQICGHGEGNQFNSSHHQAMIQFKSNVIGMFGKWKLKIYSQSKGTAPKTYGDVFIIIFTVVFVVLFK